MAEKTVDQMQKELLETQLETARIGLEKTREENSDYKRRKQVAARTNENRQRQFQSDRANLRNLQRSVCQHMAGGDAEGSPLEGGGKFAFCVLHVTIMPDGVTQLIQCPRCRLMLYGRKLTLKEEAKLKAAAEKAGEDINNPAWLKWDDYEWFKELSDLFKREGLGRKSISRGPTFKFENLQGVPIIPDTTGYSTSGGGGR